MIRINDQNNPYLMFNFKAIAAFFLLTGTMAHTIKAVYPSSDLIAQQIQDIGNDWFKQFGMLHKTDRFDIWYSPYKETVANGLMQLTTRHIDEISSLAGALTAFAKEHDMPFWWTTRAQEQSILISQLLSDKGFVEEQESFVMMHDLQHISPCNLTALHIKLIDVSQIDIWLTLFNELLGAYTSAFIEKYAAAIQHNLSEGKEKYYIAYKDKSPVAIGRIIFRSTFSYIASIATRPAYRKQGIASCLITFLLEEARKNGSHYALLEAGTAASLYEKLGFKKIMKLQEFTFTP